MQSATVRTAQCAKRDAADIKHPKDASFNTRPPFAARAPLYYARVILLQCVILYDSHIFQHHYYADDEQYYSGLEDGRTTLLLMLWSMGAFYIHGSAFERIVEKNQFFYGSHAVRL